MSSIGSSPGIGSGSSIDTSALRAATTGADLASGAAAAAGGTPSPASSTSAGASSGAAPVVTANAVSAGEMPVDTSRTQMIRQAIANGTYPIIPTKISDAFIAAGLMLRTGK